MNTPSFVSCSLIIFFSLCPIQIFANPPEIPLSIFPDEVKKQLEGIKNNTNIAKTEDEIDIKTNHTDNSISINEINSKSEKNIHNTTNLENVTIIKDGKKTVFKNHSFDNK